MKLSLKPSPSRGQVDPIWGVVPTSKAGGLNLRRESIDFQRQTVYTDARAYAVHVVLCACLLDVVSYLYVFTCSLLPGMTFNLLTLF